MLLSLNVFWNANPTNSFRIATPISQNATFEQDKKRLVYLALQSRRHLYDFQNVFKTQTQLHWRQIDTVVTKNAFPEFKAIRDVKMTAFEMLK